MPWKWDCGPRSALGLISTWEGRRGSLQFGREEKEIWAASSFSSFQTGKSQNKPQSYTKVKQIRHLKDETSRSCSFWNACVCEHHWTKKCMKADWRKRGQSLCKSPSHFQMSHGEGSDFEQESLQPVAYEFIFDFPIRTEPIRPDPKYVQGIPPHPILAFNIK